MTSNRIGSLTRVDALGLTTNLTDMIHEELRSLLACAIGSFEHSKCMIDVLTLLLGKRGDVTLTDIDEISGDVIEIVSKYALGHPLDSNDEMHDNVYGLVHDEIMCMVKKEREFKVFIRVNVPSLMPDYDSRDTIESVLADRLEQAGIHVIMVENIDETGSDVWIA